MHFGVYDVLQKTENRDIILLILSIDENVATAEIHLVLNRLCTPLCSSSPTIFDQKILFQ